MSCPRIPPGITPTVSRHASPSPSICPQSVRQDLDTFKEYWPFIGFVESLSTWGYFLMITFEFCTFGKDPTEVTSCPSRALQGGTWRRNISRQAALTLITGEGGVCQAPAEFLPFSP